MSDEAATADGGAPKKGKKKLIILLALVLILAGVGAGLWFSGILPKLMGKDEHHGDPAASPAAAARPATVFFEMPEIVANLNSSGRRASFIKLKSRLELASQADVAQVQQAMPRLLDLFQTYLREMRPDELRGSAGTHRLRGELQTRANLAAAPARIVDVLFVEMLVQ